MAFGLVMLAGLIMGVAPSSVPLMSVMVGSVAGQSQAKTPTAVPRALLFSVGFVLGMATIDAAATGEPWLGAALLFTFGLARGVPLLAVGTATGAVKHLRRVTPLVPKLERAGGVLLLLAALYFVYQSAAFAGWVPPFPF